MSAKINSYQQYNWKCLIGITKKDWYYFSFYSAYYIGLGRNNYWKKRSPTGGIGCEIFQSGLCTIAFELPPVFQTFFFEMNILVSLQAEVI